MRVTAETITDAQIRMLSGDPVSDELVEYALEPFRPGRSRRNQLRAIARLGCAVAWNARHGGEP